MTTRTRASQTMNATRRDPDGALYYSSRGSSATLPADGDSLAELLRSRAKEGFASSAYWGANGVVPPREADDVAGKQPHRFEQEISRKLVPYPQEKTSIPHTLDYTLCGMHRMTDDGNSNTGGLNASQMAKLTAGDAALCGGPDGLAATAGKPRFLTLQTTSQRMPGSFDDAVQQRLGDGQAAEDELRKAREALKKTPFATTAPDPYRLTSDDYCDMTPIDSSVYRVTECDPHVTAGAELPVSQGASHPQEVYRSRYNNVEREGPKRRERTTTMLRREHEVDPVALRTSMHADRAATMPRGYTTYSAKDWLSTTHREHAPYAIDEARAMNDPDATVPLRNTHYGLTEQHERALTERDASFARRHDGEWGTEYADNYQDRFDQAEICKDHAGRSVFDIVDGIYTIDHHYHHPRDDTATGEHYTPSEVVPGQYLTMSQEPLHARNKLPVRGSGQ